MKILDKKIKDVLKLANQVEKTPRHYGTDQLLTHSEIYLIETIGDYNESLSVTDLAKLIGITKGAISQTLKKLEKKELTTKTTDPCKGSRSIVSLLSKGKVAYYAHKHWHEKKDGGLQEFFKNITPEQVDFLMTYLTTLEGFYTSVLSDEN